MSFTLASVRRIGGRLNRPWPWHRFAAAGAYTENRCPACDGQGIVRNRAAGHVGWRNCPRCGYGDQE